MPMYMAWLKGKENKTMAKEIKSFEGFADAFFEGVKGSTEDNLIKELDEYLDEKDSEMIHMNPLKESQKVGRASTDYFFGFRHGACEVIGEITGIVNGYKRKKGKEQDNG